MPKLHHHGDRQPQAEHELGAFAREYARELRAVGVREVMAAQPTNRSQIAVGAGGLAYALASLGERRDAARARRWLDLADRWHRDRTGSDDRYYAPGESLYYGPDGHLLLRLVLDGEIDAFAKTMEKRLRHFQREPAPELVLGQGGYVLGLLAAFQATKDARLLGIANRMAKAVLAGLNGPQGWGRLPTLGMAHGRAGILYVLLTWFWVRRRAVEPALLRQLGRLWARVKQTRNWGVLPQFPTLQHSWCNGAAGHALLWVRAFEATGRPEYLQRARIAGRALSFLTPRLTNGGACCGAVGVGFGLLAIDRVDPGRGWHALAVRAAHKALTLLLRTGELPCGLLSGYPGLFMLVQDLLAQPSERLGFPWLELSSAVRPEVPPRRRAR